MKENGHKKKQLLARTDKTKNTHAHIRDRQQLPIATLLLRKTINNK